MLIDNPIHRAIDILTLHGCGEEADAVTDLLADNDRLRAEIAEWSELFEYHDAKWKMASEIVRIRSKALWRISLHESWVGSKRTATELQEIARAALMETDAIARAALKENDDG